MIVATELCRATVVRKNGQSYDQEDLQTVTLVTKGNEQVALGTVKLRTAGPRSPRRAFDVEVSLQFPDGHAAKSIKLATRIGGHEVSTENAIAGEESASMKVDRLNVLCRIAHRSFELRASVVFTG